MCYFMETFTDEEEAFLFGKRTENTEREEPSYVSFGLDVGSDWDEDDYALGAFG